MEKREILNERTFRQIWDNLSEGEQKDLSQHLDLGTTRRWLLSEIDHRFYKERTGMPEEEWNEATQ